MPHPTDLFPNLSWPAYLDHAAIGPMAQRTVDAGTAALQALSRDGKHAMGPLHGALATTRDRFAELVHGDPGGVALVASTSAAVQAVAYGIDWQPGDGVVLLRGEFPTNLTPWLAAARTFELQPHWLDVTDFRGPSGRGLSALEALLKREQVRLVAVSAVQFRCGLRMPLRQMRSLCEAHGAELFVDAIQALGAVPLDVRTDAHYLATGGQKWLMGPLGTGLAYADPDRWAAMVPRLASWLSHTDPLNFLFDGPGLLRSDAPIQAGPAIVEGGSLNLPGHTALGEALGLALHPPIQDPFAHIQGLHDVLERGLVDLGFTSHRPALPAQRSGILSVSPPAGHSAASLAAAAAERGLSVSTPDGLLRLSPSWPNPVSDAHRAVETLAALLRP